MSTGIHTECTCGLAALIAASGQCAKCDRAENEHGDFGFRDHAFVAASGDTKPVHCNQCGGFKCSDAPEWQFVSRCTCVAASGAPPQPLEAEDCLSTVAAEARAEAAEREEKHYHARYTSTLEHVKALQAQLTEAERAASGAPPQDLREQLEKLPRYCSGGIWSVGNYDADCDLVKLADVRAILEGGEK